MSENSQLGEFFSQMNTEELAKAQETFDHTPEEQQGGKVEV